MILIYVWFFISGASAQAEVCGGNARSAELQRLLRDDQNDYRKQMNDHPERPLDSKKMFRMMANDLKRRKRVDEIFGEGCLRTREDFAAAAMIFQHGEVPGHFFQAFLWFREAGMKPEQALAIDRYLTKSGRKQLFGTQFASVGTIVPGVPACFCQEQTETSFPDSIRREFLSEESYGEQAWEKFNRGKSCSQKNCATQLAPTPAGSVPGFW